MGSRQKRASIVFKTNFYCLKGYKGEGMSENDQISASVLYGWSHSILYEYYFLFRLFMLCSTKVPFWFVFSTTPPSYFILRPCYAWVLCYMKLNKIELYYIITVLLNCFLSCSEMISKSFVQICFSQNAVILMANGCIF